MTEIIRFATESLDALAVGKKIVGAQYDLIKYHTIRETSRMVSSAISLVLISLGIFMATIILLLGVGYWAAMNYANMYLIFLVPFTMLLILLTLLWAKRSLMFRSFAKQIVRDILD